MSTSFAPPPPGMGQCSVTGKIVPEDELVTLQGQRVCAEGKAILLERLRSGEAMPGESEKPTVIRRFGCILLDWLITTLPLSFLTNLIATSSRPQFTVGSNGVPVVTSSFTVIPGVMTLITTTVIVVYFGAMHASRGQSVGKIAGKLKVVNDSDGSPISSGTAYTRALVYAGANYLTGIALLTGSLPIISIASILVVVYGLVNVIMALVDGRQRALHDRICGTRVIQVPTL